MERDTNKDVKYVGCWSFFVYFFFHYYSKWNFYHKLFWLMNEIFFLSRFENVLISISIKKNYVSVHCLAQMLSFWSRKIVDFKCYFFLVFIFLRFTFVALTVLHFTTLIFSHRNQHIWIHVDARLIKWLKMNMIWIFSIYRAQSKS